jgi:hypothetical protein
LFPANPEFLATLQVLDCMNKKSWAVLGPAAN